MFFTDGKMLEGTEIKSIQLDTPHSSDPSIEEF